VVVVKVVDHLAPVLLAPVPLVLVLLDQVEAAVVAPHPVPHPHLPLVPDPAAPMSAVRHLAAPAYVHHTAATTAAVHAFPTVPAGVRRPDSCP